MGLYYDREGEPITLAQFDLFLGLEGYRRVAATQVGPYWVSTVWLGIDHAFGGGPPLIFETMVFATSDAVRGLGPDLECQRYSTEAEALQGHEDTVTLVRATTQEVP
jgi:hypothetical protein